MVPAPADEEFGALGQEKEQPRNDETRQRADQQVDAPRVVGERGRRHAQLAWNHQPRQTYNMHPRAVLFLN